MEWVLSWHISASIACDTFDCNVFLKNNLPPPLTYDSSIDPLGE